MNLAVEMLQQRALEMRAKILNRFGQDLVVTGRLKVLLVGATTILVFSAFIGLNSLVESVENRQVRSQIDLERLKEQIETSSWEERQNQSQVLKSILEERLWTAQTPGLAEAGFERWLRERLAQHHMEPQQLQIRRVPVTAEPDAGVAEHPLAGVQRMTVKILVPFDQTGLLGFLADISSGNETLVVERLIARSGRNSRIEMDVSAFFRSQERGTSGEAR